MRYAISFKDIKDKYGIDVRLLGVEIGDRGEGWDIAGNEGHKVSREAKISGAREGDLWLAWPAARGDEAMMPKPWVNMLNNCTISGFGLTGLYIKPLEKVENSDDESGREG